MQTQDIYKEEPNLCFKIWHILTTVVFSLFVMVYVGYEFEVFKINTVVDSVHPGAGSCYAPNSPTWDNCDEFKFAYENPGIAADGMPYKNVTAEYHAICVGAMTLAVIHFISVFFHCFPCTMKTPITTSDTAECSNPSMFLRTLPSHFSAGVLIFS